MIYNKVYQQDSTLVFDNLLIYNKVYPQDSTLLCDGLMFQGFYFSTEDTNHECEEDGSTLRF